MDHYHLLYDCNIRAVRVRHRRPIHHEDSNRLFRIQFIPHVVRPSSNAKAIHPVSRVYPCSMLIAEPAQCNAMQRNHPCLWYHHHKTHAHPFPPQKGKMQLLFPAHAYKKDIRDPVCDQASTSSPSSLPSPLLCPIRSTAAPRAQYSSNDHVILYCSGSPPCS